MKFYRNVFLIGITFLCGVTVRGWGAFHHQPLWGFDRLTQKVTRDSLQKNLFGQTAGICHVQYINNLRIVGVCDPRWNRVITFGYDAIADTLTYIWGTAPGSLFEPWDIDGDNVDKIYVADAGNNRVATFQIYEAQTQKPGLIDLQSYYGIGILSYPQGVDVQGSKLYVSDTRNHRIVVFDVSSHQVITTFGSYGSGDGQFNYPIGIAVKDTFIYIADTDNKRIVLLKELPNGTLQWIRNLSLPGVWTRLWSLDVDSHGKVYAIDYGYHRIIKIAGDIQQVINYFGSYGVWGEHFFEPSGISMRPDLGKVLITECWSDTSGISNWRLTVKVYEASCSSAPFYPLAEGATTPIKFKVDDTAHVYITISGKPQPRVGGEYRFIRHDTLWNLSPGVEHTFNWDGRADDGRICPPDSYSISFYPVDAFPGGTYESEPASIDKALIIGGTLHAGEYLDPADTLWMPLGNPHVFWPPYYGGGMHDTNNIRILPGVEVYTVRAVSSPLPYRADSSSCYLPYIFTSGCITAVGKPDSIILFSEYERASLRQPGYWGGLVEGHWFSPEARSDSSSEYKHCVFEYGGRPYVICYKSSANPENSKEFCGSDSLGMMFWNCRAPRIESCTLRYSWGWGLYSFMHSYPRITNCHFKGNLRYPLRLGANGLSKVTGCTFNENGTVGPDSSIRVGIEQITGNPVWQYQGLPYDMVQEDSTPKFSQPPGEEETFPTLLLVSQSGTNESLTIGAGSTLRFWSGLGIQVGDSLKTSRPRGELIADGTNGQITFTGIDTVRGDTTTRAHWNGILFKTGGDSSLLKNCKIACVDSFHVAVYNFRERPTIQGCTFRENLNKPLYLRASGLGLVHDNQFIENAFNEIWGLADTITLDATWQDQGVPFMLDFYYAHSTLVVSGTDGPDNVTTLTIGPGTEIKFRALESSGPRNIEVGTLGQPGALYANGSTGQISFRGDTIETWGGFVFGKGTDSSKTLLDSVEIYGTGYPPLSLMSQYPHQPIIRCDSCSPALRNLDLRGNEGIGLKISGGAPILYKNTIAQNDTGIYCTNGANPVMTGNKIFSNNYFGLVNDDQNVTVNATNTWWGHETGPLDDSQGAPDYNPCGQGNKVSDYVSYRPWLIDPGYGPMVSLSAGAGEYNNSQKFVRDWWSWVHAVYRSGNSVFYSYSSNQGTSWTERQLLGEGVYPTIAHDGEDSLHACWIKQADPTMCWLDTLARIYYSYKDSNGSWTSPYTLVAENSYYSPRVLYSPPSISVLSDTVRIAYERTQASMAMMAWNIDWKLYYGSFPVHNPGAVQWKALDSLYLWNVPFMPSTPIAPSINVDFNSMSHVVWQKQGVVYYKEQLQDTVWSAIKTLSADSLSTASFPSSNLYGSRLSAVWEEAIGGDNSVIHYRGRWLGEDWESDQTLGTAGNHSHRPVVDANAVVSWCENVDSLNSEIYYTKWNWYEWTTPTNISNTSARSYDPHLIAIQFMMGSDYQFLWTEGDSAPFQMTYLDIFSPWMATPWMSPWYSADIGRASFSPFTMQREGYLSYGSSRHQTIDYGSNVVTEAGTVTGSKGLKGLMYRLARLDTTFSYRLELVAYFEKKEAKSRENSDASNASEAPEAQDETKIKQAILLNGREVGQMELAPGVIDTFSFVIPKAMYRTGVLELAVDKINGKFACLSELALYRWKERENEQIQLQSQGAPQSSENVALLPKVYDLNQSYPNPARDGANIRYALPKASKVCMSIYNIAGQLIRTLVNSSQKAGYYNVQWDGRDEANKRVSNGVYLYRMQAGEFAKTRKLVILR